jgi:phosphoglucomutase
MTVASLSAQTFTVDHDNVADVVDTIKDLVHAGNVRRIIVKDAQGVSFAEFSLTVGVLMAVLLPFWAAIATIAALAANFTIQVELEMDQ